ncbi:MAG: sodium:solute symporter family protein [Bacteroidota bacterium]
MKLTSLDWILIISFFVVFLLIGLLVAKRAGKNTKEFFLSGQNMPWWLLGISMVATTFSADTPNLVTDIVRQNGVSGNWVWWAFLITGMLTVFVYAKLWRRSKVVTDLEFYELRYSGKAAAFLRGFRALYLGVFFNVMIMAAVCLAAIKIGGILFDLAPWQSVIFASVITVFYSSIGGLRGVIFTDFLQFVIAMVGSIWAAYYIINLPEIGGLDNLLANENVAGKLSFLPDFNDTNSLWVLLIIPIAVQWWSVWYPGAEPGGGGYIAQRMLSAKDEKNAIGATLLFNIAHYAIRPWPWILIALASLVLYPELSDIAAQFPKATLGHDLGYPAMLTHLPAGLLGLVVTSLIAAFMSTISTHLNWGASYISLDFYKRFMKPEASERELVNIGRLSTVVLMVLAALLALVLSNALSAFQILLQIGAGTGLIFILRWFWWRVNAYSEITGMIVSFALALLFEFVDMGLESHHKLLLSVGITTVCWVAVTVLTRPTQTQTLAKFYNSVTPYGKGWKPFKEIASQAKIPLNKGTDNFTIDLASMLLGIVFIYTSLFATGYIIYGNLTGALILVAIALISGVSVFKLWNKKAR